jgi:hypothetical protein
LTGGPALPTDEIPVRGYGPVHERIAYEVVIRDGGAIEVHGQQVTSHGTPSKSEGRVRTFSLGEGVFAGGRFVIRTKAGRRTGELTLYGSGVPVVSSEWGTLVER